MSVLCRHFGTCGGCTTQNLPGAEYRALKRDMVVRALARQGLDAAVSEIAQVPPGTRRRCVFKIAKRDGAVLIGFHARASHDIVDMRECRVLTPGLIALVPRLRAVMADVLRENETAELHATEADNGFDLAFRWKRSPASSLVAKLAAWAEQSRVARITAGKDILVEFAAPALRIGKATVRLAPGAFLQPSRAGEALLQARVVEALAGAKAVADLFAGCGTFAFALAERSKVHAVEQEAAMLGALAATARATGGLKPITTERRDLFRNPLHAKELGAFDGISLDPPRAGAAAQIAQLAKSAVRRIAYVSCNAESFAGDARVLVEAGYAMSPVIPVDQFLWSEHIELVADFTRR